MYLKRGFLTVLFLLLVPMVLGQNFSISTEEINANIESGGTAEFYLTIQNNGNYSDTYLLSVNDLKWSLTTKPLYHFTTGMTILSGENQTTTLKLKASDIIKEGNHYVELLVRSDFTKEAVAKIVKIRTGPILNLNLKNLQPDIETKLLLQDIIDPRNPVSLKVLITNNNELELNNLEIVLSSRMINENSKINIGGNNKTSAEFTISFPTDAKPQKDNLAVDVIYQNNTLSRLRKEYEIAEIAPLFEQSLATEKFWFLTKKIITLTNKGNVAKKELIKVKTYPIKLLTKTTPKTDIIIDNNQEYYLWNVALEPGASTEIIVQRNFRPVFFLIIILILIGALLIASKDPIYLRKHTHDIIKKEDGVSELKIFLIIRNKRDRTFENLTVLDRIPNILSIVEKHGVGSLKPHKIAAHGNQGTVISWKLDKLGPKEERIISYTIRTKLQIIGGFSCKPALIKFYQKGKTIKIFSNSLHIIQ